VTSLASAADPRAQLAAHRQLVDSVEALLPTVLAVATALTAVFAGGGRLYTFGNGGSAADAQHLAAELTGRYLRERRPLPAHALVGDPATLTCIANDYGADELFARQVDAYAGPGDVVAAFSTSGRSPNVVTGLARARTRGAVTVLFGGGDGGPAAEHADHLLLVPSTETARIQEMHVLLLHLVSEQVDAWAAA
jgi:D-sedoheptulose 7-phosphate isomerase